MDINDYDKLFDLGQWHRTITSDSGLAQAWFDRGLNWTYGFNHEEAVVCFKHALAADPNCAMAWWGIAYASGPFYNRVWIRFTDEEVSRELPVCFEAAQSASQCLTDAHTSAEKALINAIGLRYQSPGELDREILNDWHRQYTAAMREVYAAHRTDLDVASLFAEAGATCTPRMLWDLQTGEHNPDALTHECLQVLSDATAIANASDIRHPGLLHMQIHVQEMSPNPERAMVAADKLKGLAPDAGHLEHMPGHIYVLCGDYAQAVEQSRRAVVTDDKYVQYGGVDNFYSTSRCHDFHLYMYAAMFQGQFRTALAAADRICATATPELVQSSAPFMANILDGYSAMRTHVLVRFGQWDTLIAEPPPPRDDLTPIRAAMHAYGKGVAHATLKQFDEARQSQNEFESRLAQTPREKVVLSNPVVDTLGVGQAMLAGELAYHEGEYDLAFEQLRLAVMRDDSLNYTEPWAWMHPPRHALGALLAEQKRFEEALLVYRQDLGFDRSIPRCCVHPDNVWALHGLHECLENLDKHEQALIVLQRLELAQARADVLITSSCCCRGLQ